MLHELLAGAKDKTEWRRIEGYLSKSTTIFEVLPETWTEAARIFFDLRRKGLTVRKLADCCIAQSAMERDIQLLHNDGDFEMIATARPLKQLGLKLARVK